MSTREQELEEALRTVARALRIAKERAADHGTRLAALGHADHNRGQFLSMCEDAEEVAVKALRTGEPVALTLEEAVEKIRAEDGGLLKRLAATEAPGTIDDHVLRGV